MSERMAAEALAKLRAAANASLLDIAPADMLD